MFGSFSQVLQISTQVSLINMEILKLFDERDEEH